MYKVDSGASLQKMMLLPLTKKKTVRQSSTNLDIQTANGIVVSDTQAKVYIQEFGAHPWVQLVDYAINFVILTRGRQEKLPDYQKVRR